jgi:DNA polymerase-4
MIACVFIQDFAVVVAREYHGISPDWPLIVARHTKHQSKVFAASPEAKSWGIKPGMMSHKGLALCPSAQIVPLVDSPQRRAGDDLLEALCGFSNRLELELDHSGTVWIDLGSISDSEAMDMAQQIRDVVIDQSLFLPAIGLACGKFPARIAAVMANEGGIKLVSAGDEQALLAPFPVSRLALKKKQLEQFNLLGIETLGQLATLPMNAVQEQFGKVGKQLHGLAQGIDIRPVEQYTPRLRYVADQQFEPGIEDQEGVKVLLQHLSTQLVSYLSAKGLATQDIVLTVHLDNKQVLEARIIPREQIASQFALYTHLLRLFDELTISAPVIEICAGMENLAPPVPKQLDLFGQFFADPKNITQIVDQLTPRYGIEPFQQVSFDPHGSVVPDRSFRFKGVA